MKKEDVTSRKRTEVQKIRTVKASHYGLTVVPLPDDDFDMGIGTGQVLEVVVEV